MHELPQIQGQRAAADIRSVDVCDSREAKVSSRRTQSSRICLSHAAVRLIGLPRPSECRSTIGITSTASCSLSPPADTTEFRFCKLCGYFFIGWTILIAYCKPKKGPRASKNRSTLPTPPVQSVKVTFLANEPFSDRPSSNLTFRFGISSCGSPLYPRLSK